MKNSIIIGFLMLGMVSVKGQSTTKKITYILPDGTVIPATKIDSLSKAWGKNRLSIQHSPKDDEDGIIHLVRYTDEMLKDLMEKQAIEDNLAKAMLNKPAKLFRLTDLNGKQVSLDQLKGKVVVLNFWFTTCSPCIYEMPSLNELVNTYSGADVVFLAITFNDKLSVKTFLKDHVFNYRQLTDGRSVADDYAIHSYPTHIVIDKHGVVKYVFRSGRNIHEVLEKAIKELS